MKTSRGIEGGRARGVCVPGLVVLVLAAVGVLPQVSGRSSGAPAGACADWTPGHGSSTPQTSSSPYSISFTPATFTANGSPITVTLTTSSGATFKGFLLTAEYNSSCADQNAMPGNFTAIANSQLTCSNKAVTHSSVNSQNSLSFQWQPPATSEGHIRFRATFVRSFTTFWVNVKSPVLTDSAAGAGQSTCTPTPPTQTGSIQKDAECGKTKGCYSSCSGSDCKFLMTWTTGSSADSVDITLKGKIGSASNRYIAFGLSTDKKMGGDSVHYCINEAGGVYTSYNDGKSSQQLTNPKEGVSNAVTTFQDGVLTCTFTRTKAGGGNGKLFPLDTQYTIFWAEGPGTSAGVGRHGSIPLISTSAASLLDFTVDIGGGVDYPLIKAHGSLMVVAWICCAGIGIILARYFKSMWADQSWFGQKIWFQVHRTCMVLCLLVTATAFIIIFVQAEGYSHIHGKGFQEAHPIIGIVIMILTVVNPIMALFRPHPGTKNRPIFNWMHWAVGFGAHTLAVIEVFFGMGMDKAGAPDYTLYILIGYVVWLVFLEITLEIIQCRGRNAGTTNKYEMGDMAGGSSDSKPSPPSEPSSLKNILLGIHVVVVLGFTITLIAVLNVGEKED